MIAIARWLPLHHGEQTPPLARPWEQKPGLLGSGLPEQPRGALGTRIDPGGTQGLGQTTSPSSLTSFTCCLSRWKTCPELVAAMRSYTRYPGWLLSPQSPVSTNTTCQGHIGVPCGVPSGTAHPGGTHPAPAR